MARSSCIVGKFQAAQGPISVTKAVREAGHGHNHIEKAVRGAEYGHNHMEKAVREVEYGHNPMEKAVREAGYGHNQKEKGVRGAGYGHNQKEKAVCAHRDGDGSTEMTVAQRADSPHIEFGIELGDSSMAEPYPSRRHSMRLPGYDYSSAGTYFVIICTDRGQPRFGQIVDRAPLLSALGEIALSCWQAIPTHYPQVALDASIVMPNHMHGVLWILDEQNGTGTIPRIGTIYRARTGESGGDPQAEDRKRRIASGVLAVRSLARCPVLSASTRPR
ncbi:MAG: hypothetical protein WBO46_01625 [Caldilineaceae bacterium]